MIRDTMPVPGSTVNSLNRNKTCPSPSFDARVFKNGEFCVLSDKLCAVDVLN